MDMNEVFSLAMGNIRSNGFRSFLTMLGIIVGVASVIAVLSIGGGVQSAVLAQFERLGTSNISVMSSSRMPMTFEMYDYIMARSPSLSMYYTSATIPEILVRGQAAYNICATLPQQAVAQDWSVAVGSFITQEHVDRRQKVVVLGDGLAKDLFGEKMPLGEIVRIKDQLFEVVGVMSSFGVTIRANQDMRAFIPATTYVRMYDVISMYVTFVARDSAVVDQAVEEIKAALRSKWGAEADMSGNFRIDVMEDIISNNRATNDTIIMMLSVVSSISLLVGGIGIMNIMLVSVLERTREIGIRKAMGAKYRDLMAQFVTEAMIISLVGGMVGLVIGATISWVFAWIWGWGNVIELGTILLAFVFSLVVGLFFGIHPAQRAAKMEPIQALRHQ